MIYVRDASSKSTSLLLGNIGGKEKCAHIYDQFQTSIFISLYFDYRYRYLSVVK